MEGKIKKTLIEQLELLSERSKNAKAELLPELTAQMVNLANILSNSKESKKYYKTYLTRFQEKYFLQMIEINGIRYYELAKLIEQLGLKGQFGKEDIPKVPYLEGKIFWDTRLVDGGCAEIAFVAEDAAVLLIKQFSDK